MDHRRIVLRLDQFVFRTLNDRRGWHFLFRLSHFFPIFMRFYVLRQMIGPHESLRANTASESLLAGVRPQVSLQLVGPGEALAAEQPVADERPLAGMPPEVRLQMRRLPIHFITTGIMADVHLLRRWLFQAVLLVHTIWTLTFNAPSRLRGRVRRIVTHNFRFDHFHGSERGHVGVLGPLVVLVRLVVVMRVDGGLLRLVSAGGEVCRRR